MSPAACREGVWARDGGRKVGSGGWEEDWVVDPEEVSGDQGREEVIDVREILRLYGVPRGGTGGTSSGWLLYVPVAEGARRGGVPFTVSERSSGSTFVELFHLCLLETRLLTVKF